METTAPEHAEGGEQQEMGEAEYAVDAINLTLLIPNGHKISLQVRLAR
jgi:hypothetical protein